MLYGVVFDLYVGFCLWELMKVGSKVRVIDLIEK